MNDRDYANLYLAQAQDNGEQYLANVARVLDDAARKIEGYVETYKQVISGEAGKRGATAKPEDVLSWAVCHLMSGVLNNCRVDLLVNSAASLAEARARVDASGVQEVLR